MVIVKLMGGLGNQMFQYAAARRLAWRNKCHLKLDLSFLEGKQYGNTKRYFGLDRLNIVAQKASKFEVALCADRNGGIFETVALKTIKLLNLGPSLEVYTERDFSFDPVVLELSGNWYLQGYWQTEKYFFDIRGLLLDEFKMKSPLSDIGTVLSEQIINTNSVSVHIRRGDYVNDSKTNEIHGICEISYYAKACFIMERTIKNPHYFVFSDDPEWAFDNLKFNYPVSFVNHNIDAPQEDFSLMKRCKHHIIANSSFSWWGAWLSTNKDKIVIAPKQWFRDRTVNTADLIPDTWQRI